MLSRNNREKESRLISQVVGNKTILRKKFVKEYVKNKVQ